VTSNTAPDQYTATVSSSTALDRNVYGMNLAMTGRYEVTGVTYAQDISFDITVTDPCITTTLTDWTIPDVAIEAGLVDEYEFIEVTDSAATSVSNPTICGARTYEIFEVTIDPTDGVTEVLTAVNFIAYEEVTAGTTHKLTTHSEDEDNEVGVHNMRLVVSLQDALYPTLNVDFVVEILTPVCDCTLLDWDLPNSQTFSTTVLKIPSDEFTIDMSTVNEASKSASPKIRACYVSGGPSCDETTVMTAVIETGSTFPTYFYR
jgi:hypothetical protein